MYEKTDSRLSSLKKRIKRLFYRTKATMIFDELNVIDKSKELYRELDKMNEDEFLKIANEYYKEINPEKELNRDWLLAILLGYDAVTKYVYKHEVDRKRSRFAESIIASTTKSKEFITAMNLWWRQTEQYGITVTDEAVIQGYRDIGVKKLIWNTEKDDRVCPICRERNGKEYSIDNLPTKPHYGCRCYFTPKGVKKY